MSERNKALVRRFVEEFWNQGSAETADQLVASSHLVRDPATPGEFRGPEGVKQFRARFHDAIPDLHYTVEELVAEGDSVVARWSTTGTQRGDLPGIPATGRTATVRGYTLYRIEKGKFTEHDVVWDALGLMRQLGALPPAEPVPA